MTRVAVRRASAAPFIRQPPFKSSGHPAGSPGGADSGYMPRDMRLLRIIFFDERLWRIIFLPRVGVAIWLPGTVAGAAEPLRPIVPRSPPSRDSAPPPEPAVGWAKTGADSSIKAAAQYRAFFMWSFLLVRARNTVSDSSEPTCDRLRSVTDA